MITLLITVISLSALLLFIWLAWRIKRLEGERDALRIELRDILSVSGYTSGAIYVTAASEYGVGVTVSSYGVGGQRLVFLPGENGDDELTHGSDDLTR